ncbi:MAG: hypothetical protein IJZ09_05760 [Tidjanibacter sp.]|nr:hypothetical protein [Tidjanibacter sp.]
MEDIENKNMERACELLVNRCKGLSSLRTIKKIISLGLLSKRKCLAFLARTLVKKLTDGGMKKRTAIKMIAEKLGCSESIIRTYIYHNTKN